MPQYETCPECGGDLDYTVSIGGGSAGPCQTCLGRPDQCCPETGYHTMPHKGCILR